MMKLVETGALERILKKYEPPTQVKCLGLGISVCFEMLIGLDRIGLSGL